MTAVEHQEFAGECHGTTGFRGGLSWVLASVKRWHDRRRTLARLSRLTERQLRDVGFDPADIPGQQPSPWQHPHSRPDVR